MHFLSLRVLLGGRGFTSWCLILDRGDDFLLEDNLISEVKEPVLEIRHDSVSGSPLAVTINVNTSLEGSLRDGSNLLVGSRSLVLNMSWAVSLVVKGNEEGIGTGVVQTGHVGLVKERICEDLLEDVGLHVVFEVPLEHLVFGVSSCRVGSLIDEVGFDELLELFKQDHALGVIDRQGAEGIERGALSITGALRLGWYLRHQISVLAWDVEVVKHFFLALMNSRNSLTFSLDKGQRQALCVSEGLILLIMDLKSDVVPLTHGVGDRCLFSGVRTSIFSVGDNCDLVLPLAEQVIDSLGFS